MDILHYQKCLKVFEIEVDFQNKEDKINKGEHRSMNATPTTFKPRYQSADFEVIDARCDKNSTLRSDKLVLPDVKSHRQISILV